MINLIIRCIIDLNKMDFFIKAKGENEFCIENGNFYYILIFLFENSGEIS